MVAFFAKIINNQPKVVGTTTIKTVIFVPTNFLTMPEIAVAKAAPNAISATIHENWSVVT